MAAAAETSVRQPSLDWSILTGGSCTVSGGGSSPNCFKEQVIAENDRQGNDEKDNDTFFHYRFMTSCEPQFYSLPDRTHRDGTGDILAHARWRDRPP